MTATIASSENYKALFETMDLGVVYQDYEGNILTANSAAEKILGLSLNQMKGRTSMHPEWRAFAEDGSDLPGVQHPAMVALRTRKKVNNFLQGIYNPQLKDCVWILVNSVPQFRKGSKKPYQVYSTFLDITKRKKADEEIRKAKENVEIRETRFRKSQEAGHIGSWEYNLQTNEFWGSDEGKRIYNLPLDEKDFPLEEVINIISTTDREKVNQAMIDLVNKNKPYDIIFEIIPKNTSQKKIIHSIAELQYDIDDTPLKVAGVLLDITESKKAEEQAIESKQQLRAAFQQLQANEQQLRATVQQLQAHEQQLKASDQQLRAANQQLKANEQALIAAKQEAEKNEKYYHTIINKMGDSVFVKDEESRLILVNDAFCEIFTLERDAIIGKTLAENVNSKEQESFLQIDKQVLKTGEENINEESLTVLGDETHTISTRKTRFIDKSGKKFLIGVIRDITTQKIAEQKIRESEEKHRALYQNAPLAYQSLNINGEIIDVNPQWLKTLDYKRDDVIGSWFGEFLQAESKEHFRANFKRFKKKGAVSGVEFKMIKSNGDEIIVSFEGCIGYDDKGNFKQTYCTFKDITRQKKAEWELTRTKEIIQESERKLKNIIDNSTNMFYSHSTSHKITFISPQAREVLGYEPEELIQSWTYLLTDHPMNQIGIKFTERALRTGNRQPVYELELKHKTGRKIIVEVRESPVVENGEVTSIVGSLVDITERKQAELEIIKAKEKAEESDRLKSAFLANMSHEIRTPMNGILGFTNLLKEPDLTGKQQNDYIEIIQKSGDRMLNTVNDIIEISRIETGQIKPTSNPINISEHLLSLYNFFRLEAETKGLKLILDNKLTEAEFLITTDKIKIESIVTNLIKNAIKYTDTGKVIIGCKRKGEFLEFYVKDTGIGIPANRTEAIFNRFEQADIEDSRAFQGSGLGLSIAKSYVNMLGGEIWVESEVGVGSQFYFTLPFKILDMEISEKTTEDSNKTQSLKKGLKVLIVEDDETAITYLEIVLKDYAKEMLITKNGTDAVEICRNNPDIDMVLMDIELPGLNGHEATQQIRKFNKNVCILAQTAYAQLGDRQKAIEAGCNDYISKPINKHILFELINKRF